MGGFGGGQVEPLDDVTLTNIEAGLGVKILDFSTLAGFGITAGGTIELVDDPIPSIGRTAQAMKVTVPMGTTKTLTFPAWAAQYNSNNRFDMIYKNLTNDRTGTATWYMSVDAGYLNHYYTSLGFTTNTYRIDSRALSAFSAAWTVGAGAPTFSTIANGKIALVAPAAENLVIIIYAIYASGGEKPIVQFIFDDSHVSHYQFALPVLNKYGFKAGFATIGDLVGGVNYMTTDMLKQLDREGHDIFPHGQYVLNTFPSAAAAIAEIKRNSDFITALGLTRAAQKVYAYPGGADYWSVNDRTTITNYLKGAGYDLAYLASFSTSIESMVGKLNCMSLGRYQINAAFVLATVQNLVDHAIASGFGITFMTHVLVSAGAVGSDTNVADFDSLCSMIRSRVDSGQCVVRTPTKALFSNNLLTSSVP